MNFEAEQLLLKVADQIENHPETYDQNSWCGSKCCVAGWVVFNGDKRYYLNSLGRDKEGAGLYRFPINIRARQLLGINDDEASTLFSAAWKPPADLTVPDALRKFASGAELSEVTHKYI